MKKVLLAIFVVTVIGVSVFSIESFSEMGSEIEAEALTSVLTDEWGICGLVDDVFMIVVPVDALTMTYLIQKSFDDSQKPQIESAYESFKNLMKMLEMDFFYMVTTINPDNELFVLSMDEIKNFLIWITFPELEVKSNYDFIYSTGDLQGLLFTTDSLTKTLNEILLTPVEIKGHVYVPLTSDLMKKILVNADLMKAKFDL